MESSCLFHNDVGDWETCVPSIYQRLSKTMEETAIKVLPNPSARLQFRFYIIGHGDAQEDHTTMQPIFRTTYGLETSDKGRVWVIDRYIDDDFVRCDIHGWCERCL